eukprot:NODE_6682_length_490_cov_332.912644.p2 GENE.NODE_6682_length_490_cov_332.912644~~NODE_6682_length_490_cov_332.912644.p2  ORF type:complete len:127 (+),score=36.74 NODE_6682_length_490_cov_332.912644:3-383(+)
MGMDNSQEVQRAPEHIIIVEFMLRKLAFVFAEVQDAQRFMTCMELLVRRAQKKSPQKIAPLTAALPAQVSARRGTPRRPPAPENGHQDTIAKPETILPAPATTAALTPWCRPGLSCLGDPKSAIII